jgi:hypothetical protein
MPYGLEQKKARLGRDVQDCAIREIRKAGFTRSEATLLVKRSIKKIGNALDRSYVRCGSAAAPLEPSWLTEGWNQGAAKLNALFNAISKERNGQ